MALVRTQCNSDSANAAPPPRAPQSALLRNSRVDCLPYVDAEPSDARRALIASLIADAAAALPRDASAYLQPAPEQPTTAPPTTSLALPPQLSALQRAAAAGEAASASRGELAARFGGASWRERCARAERALLLLSRRASARRATLAAIHRRRAGAQRAAGLRLAALQRRFRGGVADNVSIGDALARARSGMRGR